MAKVAAAFTHMAMHEAIRLRDNPDPDAEARLNNWFVRCLIWKYLAGYTDSLPQSLNGYEIVISSLDKLDKFLPIPGIPATVESRMLDILTTDVKAVQPLIRCMVKTQLPGEAPRFFTCGLMLTYNTRLSTRGVALCRTALRLNCSHVQEHGA